MLLITKQLSMKIQGGTMKVSAELYGTKIGVNNNIVEAIQNKKCSIMLTLKDDNNESRQEFLLNRAEAESLSTQLQSALNSAKTQGFEVV